MGTVYKKSVTKPLPLGAELLVKGGERIARWKPAKGKSRTAPVTTGRDGSLRIVVTVGTYIAKFRDGSGHVCEVSTGCRDEDAARSVLGKLERRAELVKSEVISAAEAATADHQTSPLADHFAAYVEYLRAREASSVRIANMKRQFKRVSDECCFRRLTDMDGGKLTKWLLEREAEEMSASTRNGYRETFVMFSNWCGSGTKPRLSANPFSTVPKANVKADRRRQRRAMTESELVHLLQVARFRPLADYGRKSILVEVNPDETAGKCKRSNWTKAALTLDGLQATVEHARKRLARNPDLIAKLERLGRERAMIYKTLVLTGLRKNELASLTIGQLHLDAPMPHLELDAADEKNREGSTIPLRADLANDLRDWIADRPKFPTIKLNDSRRDLVAKQQLFTVPSGLVRILDRDLKAAGILKRDSRGRTIDVHALRHSFGTLRHSSIDLTMNVYTDPILLDVHGALDSLPSLDVKSLPITECATMKATGTEGRANLNDRDNVSGEFAPGFAPNVGKSGQSVSFAVISSTEADGPTQRTTIRSKPNKPSKKASPAVFASKASGVGATGRH
jgi:integrase